MAVTSLVASLSLPFAAAAPSLAGSATSRPHHGQWGLTSSYSATFGGFKVYDSGKRIEYFNADPAPGSGCPLQSYVVRGTFPVRKAPKASGDTWYVGQSDSAGPAGYDVTVKGGSKKYKGSMYVTFQGPKKGKADLLVDGCDLFFQVAPSKA